MKTSELGMKYVNFSNKMQQDNFSVGENIDKGINKASKAGDKVAEKFGTLFDKAAGKFSKKEVMSSESPSTGDNISTAIKNNKGKILIGTAAATAGAIALKKLIAKKKREKAERLAREQEEASASQG